MKLFGFNIERSKAFDVPNNKTKSAIEDATRAGTTGIFSSFIPSSPFTAALSTLLSDRNYQKSPREMLELYRLSYHCFTFFTRAIQIRNDFLGCPEFVSDDPGIEKALNDWAETMPIYKAGSNYIDDQGIENFAKRMHTECIKWGMSFAELKRIENSLEVEGVLLAPSDRFNHTMSTSGMQVLTYMGNSGQVYFPELGDLMPLTLRPNGEFPWGDAMATYGEFFITKAIRFLEAEMNFRERVANPTVITTIQPDLSGLAGGEGVITAGGIDEAKRDALRIKDSISDAHAHRMRTGKPSDITFVPKIPVKVEQTAFGQGIMGGTNFPTIYEQLLSNLHLITDVPSTFLGISTSAGIGTDKFRIEKAFLEKRSESDREKIENLIYQVADNYLIGIKANPNLLKNYDIKWRTTSVDDKKLEADTDLVSSQVIQQQLMNFQALLTEFGDDAANEYAVSIGKPNWYSQSGTGLQN